MNLTQRSKPDTWWQRLLCQPSTWGAVFLVIALPWFIDGSSFDSGAAGLAIIGGWLCGVSIQSAISGISSPVRSVIVHSAVAALFALQIPWVTGGLSEVLDTLPDPIRGTIIMVNFASIPAAAWIWMTLWTRALWAGDSRLRRWLRRGRPMRATVPVPQWKFTNDTAELRFTAIPMRMRTFVTLTIAMVLSLAAAGVLSHIAAESVMPHQVPQFAAIIVLLYGITIYSIASRVIRHQTMPCRVRFKPDRVRVEWGSRFWDRPYTAIDMVRWRCESDYARLEMWGPDRTVSLIAGLSKPQQNPVRQAHLRQLPELPERVVNWLADAGFTGEPQSPSGLMTLHR